MRGEGRGTETSAEREAHRECFGLVARAEGDVAAIVRKAAQALSQVPVRGEGL